MSGGPGAPSVAILVTCEHGGHRVPPAYRTLFAGAGQLLASHRGWDRGALLLARGLAAALAAPLLFSTTTRLLVDLNRSAHNPRVFSERTRALPRPARDALLAAHHAPHREAVARHVEALARGAGAVLHLAVHTFTPALNGRVRRADLALLYDPARARERRLCAAWVAGLRVCWPTLAVRRNQPYRGATDGLTTWLRRRHDPGRYLGVEVEVNQRLLDARGSPPSRLAPGLAGALQEALATVRG